MLPSSLLSNGRPALGSVGGGGGGHVRWSETAKKWFVAPVQSDAQQSGDRLIFAGSTKITIGSQTVFPSVGSRAMRESSRPDGMAMDEEQSLLTIPRHDWWRCGSRRVLNSHAGITIRKQNTFLSSGRETIIWETRRLYVIRKKD